MKAPTEKQNHVLLTSARRYEREEVDLAPPGCDYDLRAGAWVLRESGDLLVTAPGNRRPPQSKKNDVETGEDQKGY